MVVRRLPILQDRPRKLGDCRNTERPCPYLGCRANLLLDVGERGEIILNTPDNRGRGRGIWANDEQGERWDEESDAAVEAWFGEDAALRPSCLFDEIERISGTPSKLGRNHLHHAARVMEISVERARQLNNRATGRLKEELEEAGFEPADWLE